MNTTKKKLIKAIDTKIAYHEQKVQEFIEMKKLLTGKPISKKDKVT